ncbi:hypothetical protein E8E13_005741 [Curvularia kusanoi]|uniref:Heterokaryon incompatibility domain-containing protein n=1 Tax=Curvularia kusanoi TaxID=90978 RepID=A0A9P4W786_CURKU|nr:hypothetical protein E8E13_005741 [Curvularia kusanoi]
MTLGFRYLWVDRYCIPQDDEQEKNHQIRNMNLVYRNSTLTVIAAAGDGPHAGLPGINDTPRSTQLKSAHIGADTIVYMANCIFSPTIKRSKWNSRAWTFQEGLLAKRRMVFTETQVYFQCQEAHCWEIIDAEPGMLEASSTLNIPGHDAGFIFFLPFHVANSDDLIFDYFGKDISFVEDALNALTGVFSHLIERAEQSVHVLSGLILDPSIFVYDTEDSWRPEESIGWELAMCYALNWEAIRGIKRRDYFPSWTWAGWTKAQADASITFQLSSPRLKPFIETRARVTVGRQVGHDIHWDTLENLDWATSDCQITAQYLRVSAWVFDAITMASSTGISLERFSRIGEDTFGLTQDVALTLPIGSKVLGLILYEEYATNWGGSRPHHRIHYIFLTLSYRKVDSNVSCPCYERIGQGYLKLSMTEIGEEERDDESGHSWDYKTSLPDLLGARQDTVHIL